jgi:diguanylate cyclase
MAAVRVAVWERRKRTPLTPERVSSALRASSWVVFTAVAGMGAFSSYTFVSGAFSQSTLIPTSLAFGSMAISQCFSTARASAVAALTLGLIPSSLAMIWAGDYNASVLGVSLLTIAILMIQFVSAQLDHLVTEVKLQREVYALANTDGLTNLLNRRALVGLVEKELAQPENRFALALLDLDGFKGVNDRLGHLAGDDLLRVVAQRLEKTCGKGMVGRLGGDEFVVVFRSVRDAEDLKPRVQGLLGELCQPTELSGESVMVRSSLGVANFPADGQTTAQLLAAADGALYENKRERTRSGERVVATESADRRRHRGS